ncbi:MAG: IS66 family transposase [Bacteroidota bacterium]
MKTIAERVKSKYSRNSQEELLEVIAQLMLKNDKLTHKLFGSARERYVGDPEGATLLFDEAEELSATAEEICESGSSEKVPNSDRKNKPRGKRKPLPENLPRVEKILDLTEEEKRCAIHHIDLVKIGEQHSEKLEIEPAKAYIEDTITYRYKCPCCDDIKVMRAPRPPDLIPKSFASAGLLAFIVTQKYEDGLPLCRQEKIFERADIDLNRTTMARWMIKLGEAVSPLINLLHEDLINSPVIHMDETYLQVLNEPNRPAASKSYMWTMARCSDSPIVLYKYFDNRSKRAAAELLVDFKGTLVTDAYKVYDSLQSCLGYTLAGCWAHARRKFFEVEKFAKKSLSGSTKPLASTALIFIRKLYAIEADIKEFSPELKLATRQKKSVPILEEFHNWLVLNRDEVVPKSPTGKAINYTLSIWGKLVEFSRDGCVPIDNNYMERHIRPFAIGRKAWMFAAVPAGAHASANLYSLVESAKANRIQPFDYLKLIFKELPKVTMLEEYEALLPYNASKNFPLRPYNPSKK